MSSISANENDDNPLTTIFHPDSDPYKDNISNSYVVYEREIEYNNYDNKHATGAFGYYQHGGVENNIKELIISRHKFVDSKRSTIPQLSQGHGIFQGIK